ncbi:exosome catalytic subunit dis3 [Actinomortierella wolfii]|nr:exosome catalytic subunit dis3 [Actinomortierella wolfii]
MKEPMWRQKSHYQKNRSGSVVKVIREHYLRDDIWCGIETCKRCKQTEALLSSTPNINKLYPLPHFLVPDTNILINQASYLLGSTTFWILLA